MSTDLCVVRRRGAGAEKREKNVTHLKPTIFLRNYYQIKSKNVTKIEKREWYITSVGSDIELLHFSCVYTAAAAETPVLYICVITIWRNTNECGVVERKKIISEITTTNHSLLLLPSHHNHVIKHDILIFSLETRHAGECFISVTCQMFHLLLIFISRLFHTTYYSLCDYTMYYAKNISVECVPYFTCEMMKTNWYMKGLECMRECRKIHNWCQ